MNPGAPYGLCAAVLRGLCGRLDGTNAEQAWTRLYALSTSYVGDKEALFFKLGFGGANIIGVHCVADRSAFFS